MGEFLRRLRRICAVVLCGVLILDPYGLTAQALTVTTQGENPTTIEENDGSGKWIRDTIEVPNPDNPDDESDRIQMNFNAFSGVDVTFGEDDLWTPSNVYLLADGTVATGDFSQWNSATVFMDGTSSAVDNFKEDGFDTQLVPNMEGAANISEQTAEAIEAYVFANDDDLRPDVNVVVDTSGSAPVVLNGEPDNEDPNINAMHISEKATLVIPEGESVSVGATTSIFAWGGLEVKESASLVGTAPETEEDPSLSEIMLPQGSTVSGLVAYYRGENDALVPISWDWAQEDLPLEEFEGEPGQLRLHWEKINENDYAWVAVVPGNVENAWLLFPDNATLVDEHNVDYTVGEATVRLTVPSGVNINEDGEGHFSAELDFHSDLTCSVTSAFDPDTMEIKVQDEHGGWRTCEVNDGSFTIQDIGEDITLFIQNKNDNDNPPANRSYGVIFAGVVSGNVVTYTVGEGEDEQQVTLTVSDSVEEGVTIDNTGRATIYDTTGFVLSDNYNPDTMEVRVTEIREGDNPGFSTDLGVDSEYRTGITALPENTYLPGGCDFRIEVTLRDNNSQGPGEGPGQDQTFRIKINGAIGNNGTTASSFISSTAVVITVPEGKTIDGDGYTRLSSEDVLTISGFNSETMELKIVGENNYNSVLAVSNNSFSLNGLNLPEGDLTIMVQAQSSGGGQEPEQNEPQPPVNLDLNAGDVGIVISNLRYGAVQYKIGNGSWTTVGSDTITVTAAQLSAAGATNGTSIYFKATPNPGQYFDNHEGGNEVKINNVSQGLVESDLLALAGDTGWSYTYDSTKTFQIRIAFDGHDNIAFNGKMIFAWKGAGGALCMHTINDISGRRITSGGEAYDINYILLSTIKDDTNNEQYVIGNNDYMWVWEGRGAEIEALNITTWSGLCSYTNSLSEDDKRAFIADPTGARNGNATVCTNGDRNFRATIYDATKFVGIAFKADESEYTYFPDYWDPTFFSNVLDITDTTASNPAMYETSILEPSLIFSTDTRSVDTISAVRAVGIPQKAISVTNSNGQISVVLRSNFYSQVLLELEGASGRKYYVKIIRKSMNVMDDMGPGRTDSHVIAELYYDENKSYSDYDVYCTKYYSDGSTAVVQCEAAFIEYAFNGDEVPVNTKVIPAGKGLEKSQYMVSMESGVVSYSFNVTNHGAMTGDTFGGSFVGSSKGVTYTDRAITY